MTEPAAPVTRAEWLQLKTALAAALEAPREAREAVLREQLSGHEHLLNEARALLSMQASGDALLEGPGPAWTSPAVTQAAWTGQRIGPWRLERELGAGGMGVVHLARREDGQFRAQAAIKLLRQGPHSDSLKARFRNERQVLATLQHPGIARLLDGGVTDEGLPYLVMEYIEGEPIDRYCDRHALDLRARLKLFCQVAAAVHYAHSHLVVHRDLKPGNILVTAQGEVKLLDFGISKILAPEIADVALETRLDQGRPLTPAYASPEQVAGDGITTASDVYSLGVLLHELLTGQLPGRDPDGNRLLRPSERVRAGARKARPFAAAENLSKPDGHGTDPNLDRLDAIGPQSTHPGASDPAAPVRAPASGPPLSPDALAAALAGDLDNIVLMALRDEPARRYASAEALADDVRRHLEDLPVLARPNSLGYQMRKFVRRHRIASGLVAVALAGLVVTTAVAIHLAQRAERERLRADQRFQDVRKLAGDMIFKHHEALRAVPGASAQREALLKDALAYLDRLAADSADNPGLQVEIATGYMRIAQIQGEEFSTNLGKFAEARANVAKSLALMEKIDFDRHKALAGDRDLLGQGYIGSGMLALQAGEAQTAIGFYDKARDFYARRVAAEPGSKRNLEWLAASHQRIGEVKGFTVLRLSLGDTAAAHRHLLEGLAVRERMLATWPGDDYIMHQVAQSLGSLGLWHWHYGQPQEAEAYMERTLRLREATLKARPDFPQYQRDMVAAQVRLADIRSDHGTHLREALDTMRSVEQRSAALASLDRADSNAARDLAGVRLAHARILLRAGRAAEAAPFIQASLQDAEPAASRQDDFYARVQWLQALFNAAEHALQTRNAAAARQHAERAQTATGRLLARYAQHPNIRLLVAQAEVLRARAALLDTPRRDCASAQTAASQALAQWEAVPPALLTHQARAIRTRLQADMKAC